MACRASSNVTSYRLAVTVPVTSFEATMLRWPSSLRSRNNSPMGSSFTCSSTRLAELTRTTISPLPADAPTDELFSPAAPGDRGGAASDMLDAASGHRDMAYSEHRPNMRLANPGDIATRPP